VKKKGGGRKKEKGRIRRREENRTLDCCPRSKTGIGNKNKGDMEFFLHKTAANRGQESKETDGGVSTKKDPRRVGEKPPSQPKKKGGPPKPTKMNVQGS